MSVSLYPLAASKIVTGGTAVTAMNGPVAGGLIANPPTAHDQGLLIAEPIFVDVTGTAALGETATTFELLPGESFLVPEDLANDVSVNAATAGHRFSGYVKQPVTQFPPTAQQGSFPPEEPTSLTLTIPSYLYKEYADDADLQGFVNAFNGLAQGYVDWFNDTPLPVYTDPAITGALLDWVALGLYGIRRPSLSSGKGRNIGAYGTFFFGRLPYGVRKLIGPTDVVATSDDVFKRILTWNLYKGDGHRFNIRWLKRRLMRFLIGTNGSAPNIDNTYPVSVSIGPGIISIRINAGTRTILKGPYGTASFGVLPYGAALSRFTPSQNQLPFASVLQEAIESGVLQFPFQLSVTIAI